MIFRDFRDRILAIKSEGLKQKTWCFWQYPLLVEIKTSLFFRSLQVNRNTIPDWSCMHFGVKNIEY